ncbi:hypothetical protein LPJ56_006392, partial [Coemansia sp. RSA 2599]
MRTNRHIALCRKFLEQINAYRRMEHKQVDKNRDRLVRLLNIACPDLADEEIMEVIDIGIASELVEEWLANGYGPGETHKITKDVNDRLEDISNIKYTINELSKLNIELSDMINRQQARLDTITVC